MNTDQSLEVRVRNAKESLGDSTVILGHHYQRDEVIQFADFRGDSLKLARDAAECVHAQYIVFCGVHFMAETASVLAQPGQTVVMPVPEAGCFLADRANLPDVERAWSELGEVLDVESEVMPITYVNSAAELKAFCGDHGGLVCTSSNAPQALAWALERRPRALFFPDQHLGRNIAKRSGVALSEMVLWDSARHCGGHTADELQKAGVFLWNGACNVHQRFLPAHVAAWRERDPDIRIIVHPECMMEVVDLADEAGSTAFIIKRVQESTPGTRWAIGTESNLVNRLKAEYPDQFIETLSPRPNYCRTMSMTTLESLVDVLEGLSLGSVTNVVSVPADVARSARVALERMLEVSL